MKPRLENYWDDRTFGLSANNLKSQYAKDTIEILKPILGKINLEVGSGFGRMIPVYDQAGVEYIGIEIDKRAAYFTQKHFKKEIVIGDMRCLPFKPGAFDSVLSVGAVEHVPETQLSLYEHLRVTKKMGKCFVLIPSLYSPFIFPPMIRAMKRRYNGRDFQIHFGSRYTMKRIRKMLTEIHASIVYVQHVGISLPGRFELWFHRIDKSVGNAYLVIFERNISPPPVESN